MAAASLLRLGWQVRAVHLRLSPHGPPPEHVQALARALGIPLSVLDLQEDFSRRVLDYFSAEYTHGRTPNPCVQCNAAIKFGRLWQILEAQGISYLATGHYVRLLHRADGTVGLHRGADRTKDQSYFLQRLPRELLPHLLFPLGETTKQEVRRRYRELGLPPLSGGESQELCFIPQGRYDDFLRDRLGSLGRPGEFVDAQGCVLGRHRGLEHYTVGQRRGLGVAARKPYYVIEIQPAVNRVVLGPRAETYSSGLLAGRLHWLINPPAQELEVTAVIRYRHPGVAARLLPLGSGQARVIFATPQTAVAPGQAVAFYHEDRLLGGGWIEERNSLPNIGY